MKPDVRRVTLLIDTREHQAIPFPRTFTWFPYPGGTREIVIVETKHLKLDSGDLALSEHEHIVRIERKGSTRELCTNLLTRDFTRQAKSLTRLVKSCTYPAILIETCPVTFLHESTKGLDYPSALDALLFECNRLHIEVLWGGNHASTNKRISVGEFCLRWMLSKIIRHTLDTELGRAYHTNIPAMDPNQNHK